MKQNWNDFIAPLYNEEYERLFKIAYRKTKNWDLSQDLVQDVFLLAIFNQSKLMQHPKPNAWLMQTLQNLILNELRERSHSNIPLDEAIEVPAREACASLDRLLPTQLPARDREILIWRFEQNMSYSEMSGRLGVPEDLCRKWISRAIIKCRALLQKQPIN